MSKVFALIFCFLLSGILLGCAQDKPISIKKASLKDVQTINKPVQRSLKKAVRTRSKNLGKGPNIKLPIRRANQHSCECPNDYFMRKGKRIRCRNVSAYVRDKGREPSCSR